MGIRLKDVVGVNLPATQAGRFPRPNWYTFNIGDRGWTEVCNESGFLEAYTDAVRTVIIDHEMTGLDILTDGCTRYDSKPTNIAAWDTNALVYIGGARKVENKPDGPLLMTGVVGETIEKATTRLTGMEHQGWTGTYWWVIEDEPSVGKLGLWLETFKIASSTAHGKKPLKFSGPSAGVAGQHCFNRSGRSDRDVYFALAKTQNKILREIANAGCKIIQIDYPFGFAHWAAQFDQIKQDVWRDLVEGFNEEIKGVNAHIWVHFCFGAPGLYSPQSPPLSYNMAKVYPHISECKADCIQTEAANTGGRYLEEELQSWKDHLPEKDYAVGAVTPYSVLETADNVDSIIETALKYVPLEKLALSSDEGIAGNGMQTRRGAIVKMRMLAEAARKARQQHRA
jgi:methionine synthase II (cobalamin-independent)